MYIISITIIPLFPQKNEGIIPDWHFCSRGIMNIEDGMDKDACWNGLFPSLRKDFPELRGIWKFVSAFVS